MRAKVFPLFALILGLLLLQGCGTNPVTDTVKSWFKDKTAKNVQTRKISAFEYEDKLMGAWGGKMIGVSYGAPYEFRSAGKIMDDPIRAWKPEYVSNALGQDDLYVQLTYLQALEDKGLAVTSAEAGRFLANSRYGLAHANDIGRRNLRAGILPPNSGHPRYNPHANDIDFQIEADLFGILSPGMPQIAVRLAGKFGCLTNYGDGIYGGVFVAAMYTFAYFETDPTKVVELGLRCIPAKSEYARLIGDVLAYSREHPNPEDWRGAWEMLEKKWAQNDLCPDGYGKPFNIDAKLNGGYVALALLYGKKNFDRTLEIAVRCGQDNDCNPSTAAGILGTILGYSRIPSEYKLGIPVISDRAFEYTNYNFNTLIQACKRLTGDMIERYGGNVDRLGGLPFFSIPIQAPPPQKDAEQYTEAMLNKFKPEWPNLEKYRLENMQKILQGQLNTWAKGWSVSSCGEQINPGILEEYFSRFSVFVTHPVNADTPCALTWKGKLPADKPALNLTVASSDISASAEWQLRVKVNNTVVHESTIGRAAGKIEWREVKIDLSAYAGQEVTLVLENTGDDKANRAAYWGKIAIKP